MSSGMASRPSTTGSRVRLQPPCSVGSATERSVAGAPPWQAFLAKYPEANRLYRKMLSVSRKLAEALEATKQLKGSTSRVVAAAVRNLDRDREHIEDIVAEQILHESSHLNRFGTFIIVIAAVSPLLGLLGTVTGMISTFDIITEFGTGDPKLLSSGISIALVTTEVGLAVAIPALIFGNLLSGWAESIKDDMEKAALHVMNRYKGRPAEATAAA